MKFKLKDKNVTDLKSLLESRGVSNLEAFLNPTSDCLQSPFDLENMKEGANLLYETLTCKDPIALVVDCDCDGFTSSAIIYQYIKSQVPDILIMPIIHEGKQHGLEDCTDKILEMNPAPKLVILPDASTNDDNFHRELVEAGMKILVLDHHLPDNEINSPATIINNQLSPNYKNKELTGAGITFQFCRAFDETYGYKGKKADYFIDLAALGIDGDMGSILDLENRYIMEQGFKNINNGFFKALIDKQAYSMNNEVTPINVSFYIVPLINAMIRVGTMEEKERMFYAFVDGDTMIPSSKRGAKGELEKRSVESARECTNARAKQNRIKDKAVDLLEAKIFKYDLLENKILFVRLEDDEDFPPELNGLIAMTLAAKFKKPTIVARKNDEEINRGSGRGLNNSELKDFRGLLENSGYFEYALGHSQAFGCSIPDKDLSEFHNWANTELADLNFNENIYDVDFIRTPFDRDLEDLIINFSRNKNIWGTNNEEPVFLIKEIYLSQDDIQVIGSNKDTLKFTKNNITYIKFHAKELIEDLTQYEQNIKMKITGKGNINEWMGNRTAQIFINDYEIENNSLSLEF